MQEPSWTQSVEEPHGDTHRSAGCGAPESCQARLYVFCVLGAPPLPGLGLLSRAPAGPVALVRAADLAAVVGPAPAALDGESDLLAWVERHARTIELVREACPDVLPLRAGTVFRGETEHAASHEVARWLDAEQTRLRRTLDHIRGHDEYGVEAWCRQDLLFAHLQARDPELAALEDAARAAANGTAYLLRSRLDRLLDRRRDEFARQVHEALLDVLRGTVRDVTAARLPRGTEPAGGRIPLLALSALVERSRKASFLACLESFALLPMDRHAEHVGQGPDCRLRLTGPWPPYSFVSP